MGRAQRKASIRELASAAFELDLSVLRGQLRRDEDGRWVVENAALDDELESYVGHEVVVIVASFDDERPVPLRVCRTCGTEYRGLECPRCRRARTRLRNR
jgi:hypothetical protein